MKFFPLFLSLFFVLFGCSGISRIPNGNDKQDEVKASPQYNYSESYLKRFATARELFRKNQTDKALQFLKNIKEDELNPLEKASRENLTGVILFSKSKFDDALRNFEKSIIGASSDNLLLAQVHLNLAGAYFKKGMGEKAFEILKKCPSQFLTNDELKKYHMLSARLAKDLGQEDEELVNLVFVIKNKKKISELKGDVSFERARAIIANKSFDYQLKFFNTYENERPLVIGYMAFEAAEKVFYSGDREKVKELLTWIEEGFVANEDLMDLVKNFNGRIENFSKMDVSAIGVVLPLSGDKKDFSERVLQGLDLALNGNSHLPINLQTKDSEGSGPIGAFAVKELIEKNNVAVVIGGLFPDEATNEYLEARKNGVLFISLSSIYLPKEQKDHLLLEIPGSIESQMNDIFSPQMLKNLGKRAAIIYPKGSRGESYVEEFWRRAQLSGVEVTGVTSFEKNLNDYRDIVKGVLELKYKRERQEELDLLSGVQSLEKTNTRRVQVLGPQVDFDWVFMPALPKEALQIIPAFGYFDAFKLSYVGDASWRSQLMSREGGRMGKLYFVADDVDPNEKVFTESFEKKYGHAPKLLEYMGFDSLKLTQQILAESKANSRDELDRFVKTKSQLVGITGKWKLDEGIWLKNLGIYAIKRDKIESLTPTVPTTQQ